MYRESASVYKPITSDPQVNRSVKKAILFFYAILKKIAELLSIDNDKGSIYFEFFYPDSILFGDPGIKIRSYNSGMVLDHDQILRTEVDSDPTDIPNPRDCDTKNFFDTYKSLVSACMHFLVLVHSQ